jgi:hypothetical protein
MEGLDDISKELCVPSCERLNSLELKQKRDIRSGNEPKQQ